MKTLTVKNESGDVQKVEEDKISQAEKDGYFAIVSNGTDEQRVPYDKIHLAKKDGFEPVRDLNLLQKGGEIAMSALHGAGQVIEHFGPGQIKNLTSMLVGQKDLNLETAGDLVTGSNAPSFTSTLNKAEFPSFDLDGLANTENVRNLKTTPSLSQDEQMRLRNVKTGLNSNDLLGLALDFKTGDQAVSNLISAGKALAPAVKSVSTMGRGTSRAEAAGVQSQSASGVVSGSSKSTANISGGGVEVEQGGQLFEKTAPKTLDELRGWNPEAGTGEMVAKKRLVELEQSLPDLPKPLKYHYDMYDNPKSMRDLKNTFERLPTDDAKRIAAYPQNMLKQAEEKTRETIKSISGYEPKTLGEVGDEFISAVKDKYTSTKSDLAPVFKELKNGAENLSKDDSIELAYEIGKNTNAGKLLSVDQETGKMFLAKNTPKVGMSDQEHSILKRVIDDLNDGMTYEELQKSREFLRKAIDPTNPRATEELNKVRSIMLNKMESMAEGIGGGARDTMKQYAINERKREAVESIIGGKIESLDSLYLANPEKVVSKIFSNPNNAKTVIDYVGPELGDRMVQSYINNGVRKSFDSVNGFSPVKFKEWLRTNSNFMQNYVEPEVYKRMVDLGDYGVIAKQIAADSNPSGTADKLLSAIEPKGFFQKVKTGDIKGAVVSEAVGRIEQKLGQKQALKTLSEALGETPQVKKSYDFSKVTQNIPSPKKVGQFSVGLNSSNSFNKVSVAAENDDSERSVENKFIQDGVKKLQAIDKLGELKDSFDELKKSKKGQDLLLQASSMKADSPALQKVIERIKQTDEYKKTAPKASDYPKRIQKGKFFAVVKNQQEESEARREGWL